MPVTMQKTDMFYFTKRQIPKLFESLGVSTFESHEKDCEEKTVHVLKSDGEQATCEGCSTDITFSNLGHVTRGSNLFYCDNPACFTHFIANKKIR